MFCRLPQRTNPANDIARAALRNGRISHRSILRPGGFGNELHRQVRKRGNTAHNILPRRLKLDHQGLKSNCRVDPQFLNGFFTVSTRGRIMLVLVNNERNPGLVQFLDCVSGA